MMNVVYVFIGLIILCLIVLMIKIKDVGVRYDKAKKNIDPQHKGKYAVQFAGTDAMALIPYPIKDNSPELMEYVSNYNKLTKLFWVLCAVGILFLIFHIIK